MKENLEKRKEHLLSTLAEEYKDKPGKWWHGVARYYIPTNEAALESKIFKIEEPLLFIKNNPQYYYSVVVFFLCCAIMIIWSFWGKSKIQTNQVLLTLLFLGGIIYGFFKIFSARSRMIISPEGIWLDTNDVFIPWNNIVASFIERVINDGEECYLILHYYELSSDEFKKTVYRLNNVGIKYQDLSLYIEYWKLQTGKNLGK